MNKNITFYRINSDPYQKNWRKKYIWAEVLNWHTEEECKKFWWKYKKPKYEPLPNTTIFSEWGNFNWTLYLWIQTWSVFWDIIFWWTDFIINEKVKTIFEKEWLTWYKLYNVEFPKNLEAPKYWWIIPKTDINIERHYTKDGDFIPPMLIKMDTWNWDDIVSFWWVPTVYSEKVKEIFEKYNIDNVRFDIIEWENYKFLV